MVGKIHRGEGLGYAAMLILAFVGFASSAIPGYFLLVFDGFGEKRAIWERWWAERSVWYVLASWAAMRVLGFYFFRVAIRRKIGDCGFMMSSWESTEGLKCFLSHFWSPTSS